MSNFMLYKKLEFTYGFLKYNLKFNSSISFISGDSGTGKTFLSEILAKYAKSQNKDNIIVFNYLTPNFKEILLQQKFKFIVIDNADILLTDELKEFVNESENQFVIMGRDNNNLGLGIRDFYELERVGKEVRLKNTYEEIFMDWGSSDL